MSHIEYFTLFLSLECPDLVLAFVFSHLLEETLLDSLEDVCSGRQFVRNRAARLPQSTFGLFVGSLDLAIDWFH